MKPYLPQINDPRFLRELEDELDKRPMARELAGLLRPTNVPLGTYFFDTDLGKPIWAASADEGVITWVDATGTEV